MILHAVNDPFKRLFRKVRNLSIVPLCLWFNLSKKEETVLINFSFICYHTGTIKHGSELIFRVWYSWFIWIFQRVFSSIVAKSCCTLDQIVGFRLFTSVLVVIGICIELKIATRANMLNVIDASSDRSHLV